MIDDLKAIAIFAETIKQGSFRKAAQTLDLSPSVVSYHIGQLEQKVGNALIYRSTRKLSLTSEGEVLYQHAMAMLSEAQRGLDKVIPDRKEPSGKLTITIPALLTRAPITQRIANFAMTFPKVELRIISSDDRQNLLEHGIDLAIRVGHMEDSGLKSKKLGDIERKLVCSPDYLSAQKAPNHPLELSAWKWIKMAMMPNYRTLIDPQHQVLKIPFDAHTAVNSVDLMTQLCIHGLGLATPPDFLVSQALETASLIEILPEWKVESIPVYAVWPANVSPHSVTRQLLDVIAQV